MAQTSGSREPVAKPSSVSPASLLAPRSLTLARMYQCVRCNSAAQPCNGDSAIYQPPQTPPADTVPPQPQSVTPHPCAVRGDARIAQIARSARSDTSDRTDLRARAHQAAEERSTSAAQQGEGRHEHNTARKDASTPWIRPASCRRRVAAYPCTLVFKRDACTRATPMPHATYATMTAARGHTHAPRPSDAMRDGREGCGPAGAGGRVYANAPRRQRANSPTRQRT